MKENENLYNIISNFIRIGKTESAITYLSEININSNEIILIESQFADLESGKRKGIITQEYYDLQKNRISNLILDIARKHSSINDDVNKKSKKETTPLFWVKFAILILIISLISYVIINVKPDSQLNKNTPSNTPLVIKNPVELSDEVDSNTKTDTKPSKETNAKEDRDQIVRINIPKNQVNVPVNSQKDTIVVVKYYPKPNDNETKRIEKKESSLSENVIPNSELSESSDLKNRTYSSKVIDKSGKGISNVEIYCPNCLTQGVFTKQDGSFELQGKFSESDVFWQSELIFSSPNDKMTITVDWRDQSPQPIKF